MHCAWSCWCMPSVPYTVLIIYFFFENFRSEHYASLYHPYVRLPSCVRPPLRPCSVAAAVAVAVHVQPLARARCAPLPQAPQAHAPPPRRWPPPPGGCVRFRPRLPLADVRVLLLRLRVFEPLLLRLLRLLLLMLLWLLRRQPLLQLACARLPRRPVLVPLPPIENKNKNMN